MSGISSGAEKYFSPTNDYNRSGGEGTVNVNVVSNMSQMVNRTSERLFQVAAEPAEGSELLISSSHRVSGTSFNFTTDIGGPLFRPRQIRLENIIIPKIPNITRQNNVLNFQFVITAPPGANPVLSNPIDLSITIPLGYYEPYEFCNVLVAALRTAVLTGFINQPVSSDFVLVGIDPANLKIACEYDDNTGRCLISFSLDEVEAAVTPFSVSFTASPISWLFWLTDDCPFALRGKNFIPFTTAPRQLQQSITGPGLYQVPAWFVPPIPNRSIFVVGTAGSPSILTSLMGCGFIYTRYVTISSAAISLYAFSESRVDRAGAGGGSGKVVGVINTSSYTPHNSFTGGNRAAHVDSATISIRNSQLKLNELIDFSFTDEYGINLDESFPIDNNWGASLDFLVTY